MDKKGTSSLLSSHKTVLHSVGICVVEKEFDRAIDALLYWSWMSVEYMKE